jgi:hypothetical protein
MNKKLSNTEYYKRSRMMFAVCRYMYCKHHNMESMSREEFKKILNDQKICLPRVKDFISGKHIEYNNNIFTIEDGSVELNSTLINTDTSSIDIILDDSINSTIFHRSYNEPQPLSIEQENVINSIPVPAQIPLLTIEPTASSMSRVSQPTSQCLGLNKTVDSEEIHWHVDKISDMRTKGRKRQYRVHWSSHNGKKFRPSWQNESNLNCSELIREFDPETTFKKTVNENDLEITRSEVDLVNKKFKTNNWHVTKRQ